jgi:hypothetical protein
MQNLLCQANEAMQYKELRRLFEEFQQTDEQGLSEMMNGMLLLTEEERHAALNIAVFVGCKLRKDSVFHLLSEDSENVFERAAAYCQSQRLNDAAPIILGRLSSLSDFNVLQRAIETLCKLRYVPALPQLELYYDTHIKRWPTRLADYMILKQLSIPLSRVKTAAFPKKNISFYMPVGQGQSEVPKVRNGGPTCPGCQRVLMELFHVPSELISDFSTNKISIFHCDRCLFHRPLFLQRQPDDRHIILGKPRPEVINTDDEPLISPGAIRWVDAGSLGDGEEFFSFIGGSPRWLQRATRPKCPVCQCAMTFVLQLESDFSDTTGIDFGYGGTMYLHVCPGCAITVQTYQVD